METLKNVSFDDEIFDCPYCDNSECEDFSDDAEIHEITISGTHEGMKFVKEILEKYVFTDELAII